MHTRIRKPNPLAMGLLAALLLGLTGTSAMAGTLDQATQGSASRMGFTKFDSNGDGYISLDEFTAQHMDAKAFQEADANHDGRLDQDEFVKALAINDRIQAGDYLSDTWITTKVKTLLMKDDLLSGLGINVDTRNGDVQLSGWVNNQDQASRAVQIASNVKGVKIVHNNLELKN